MAVTLIVLGGLAFLGLCWFVGARRRLLRLQGRVWQARVAWHDSLREHANWVIARATVNLQNTDLRWQVAHRAATQLLAVLPKTDGKRSLQSSSEVLAAQLAHWQAWDALKNEKSSVSSQCAENLSEKDCIPIKMMPDEWAAWTERVQIAQQGHHGAVSAYNHAIGMFPANGLAWLLRLRAADVFSESPSPS